MKIREGREKDWQETCDANQDEEYDREIIEYATRWADLMEKEIADGAKVEDIAEKTSTEANINSITGFMYGAAAWILSHHWEHGEELRHWHNLDTQIGDEGERANERPGAVLNPAMMGMSG